MSVGQEIPVFCGFSFTVFPFCSRLKWTKPGNNRETFKERSRWNSKPRKFDDVIGVLQGANRQLREFIEIAKSQAREIERLRGELQGVLDWFAINEYEHEANLIRAALAEKRDAAPEQRPASPSPT